MDTSLSRRDLLRLAGALVVSAAVPGVLDEAFAQPGPATGGKPPLVPGELDSWIAVLPDGSVSAFFGKMDMGQSLDVAIAQIVAEELDVPVERVTVFMGDTKTSCNQGGASGSFGVSHGARPLRNAAAEARRILLELAARRLGVPAERLAVVDGVVGTLDPPARTVTYAELIGGKHFNAKVEWNKTTGNFMDVKVQARPKSPSEYRVVGKSVPRRDVEGKVFGTADFVTDVRLPKMLHARMIRPPKAGATVAGVDEESIRSVGGARVVRDKDFLAVVAEREWDAVRAARMLKVTWTAPADPFPPMETLHDHIRAATPLKREEPVRKGDLEAAFKGAARVVEAEYEWPFQSHASMGPACAVADVKGGRAEIWSPSQAPHWLRREVAVTLQMQPKDIHIQYLDGAGCYGRNGHEDATCDAALLSKLTGKPVRVQWTREDEHGWDPKGPPTLVEITAGLDARGDIVGWDSELWVPKADITEWPRTLAATAAGIPQAEAINPGNIHRNLEPPYQFANQRAVAHRLDSTPLRPSWIRTPGRMQNTYANEVFIDECAAAARIDPIEYRLRYLKDPRGIAVLRAAASMAKWETRPSPRRDRSGPIARGRGFAYVKYENARTYCAGVAEVEVNRQTGAIRCTRFFVAHDCGQIINPDGTRAQIEGNIIQTVSRTLKEELKWNRSRVTSVDWASYPILKFPEVPEVVMELISRPNDPPWGVGEPSAVLPPPAISNAVFDAIGVRLRSVPFTPPKVMAATKAAGRKA
jgi:nicotinate dehydrogenase subunit B